jgi:hypothetical protein
MIGKRVRVHYNLHRGDYSVIDPAHGRVIANVDNITLVDVEFRVQAGGLRMVRERGHRRVCAYAIGTVAAVNSEYDSRGLGRITFNPFRADRFHWAEHPGESVEWAGRVFFAGRYCYAERTP